MVSTWLKEKSKEKSTALENQELKQARPRMKSVWRRVEKPDEHNPPAPTCMVCLLPNEFMAPTDQVVQEEVLSEVDETEQLMAQLMLSKQATFEKPSKNRHMKPLYLRGFVNGKPLTKMFVDGGAAVNVMPYTTFRKLGMGLGDLTPTSIVLNDFAGNPSDTKGCVHVDLMMGQKLCLQPSLSSKAEDHIVCCLEGIGSMQIAQLIQWIDDEVEIVQADDSISVASMETAFWEYQGIDCFSGKDWGEGPVEPIGSDQQPIQANPIDGTDGKLGRGFVSADKLEEVDIGDGDKPRPTFISANLDPIFKEKLIKLLKEYKDCFAWDYSEMPGLDRSIVEHRLPIKPGYKPYKQPPRKIYKEEVLADVKKEIERLLDANFIRPCKYADWISNIVPVYKKNGKMRVCIDFRDLNKATPMDGYPMPVADSLVDAAAGYKVLSFMDGNAGYNQIFMALEDIVKTAFRCPGHIGLFELWKYIDDVVIKSLDHESHLADIRKTLECTRKHGLKMNPNKCAFGVSAGEFLGFLIHEGGIGVGKKSMKAIDEIINFVRRFISNLSQKVLPFSSLLKVKKDQKFIWGDEQQKAFDEIKEYMKEPPVLVPPQLNKPFKLYVAADAQTIGSALIQEFEGKERVVAYLSRKLLDPKQDIQLWRSFAYVYYSCTKFRHYLLNAECIVYSKFDVIKHMLSMPILNGRIGKWILALSEFELKFESAKAVKGQIIADFITEHRDSSINLLNIIPWVLFFDGSSCDKGGGAGILLTSPKGEVFKFAIPIQSTVTNNQAEYEALLKGLQYLKEARAIAVEIFGDSELVIKQLSGEYECKNDVLRNYYEECKQILKGFRSIILQHIPRGDNEEANKLAQSASGYRENQEVFTTDDCAIRSDLAENDWRKEIADYLENPSQKSLDGVLLRCLNQEEAKKLMSEVHDGLCGAHQSAYRMKWVIRRTGITGRQCWKTALNIIRDVKTRVPASALNPIIKPWPFRGWGIDLIGQIYPPSSKGHKFVLLATDYFTKWVEAIPLRNAEASNKIMIKIIQKKIDQKPRKWHSVLNEALWAYRMAPHGSTKTSPYELVYGHHAVLPWEVQRDLVWKALLPIGTKYSAFGKWSPNWEGPFRIFKCVPGNAYILKTLLGEEFTAAINGRYLKKYYPSIEIDR
ncbi:Transposon Ty3-I Gag-Pol polyprotein [Gossypium australe]|uniref:Transposon Ty3-I Gag-Pol polyprotein n=1 Tax=Gossypium australe TaxID=47621 RepID=A0A5B6U7E3_9ROSI|nr:Transposon Ty3-I Gag-Pol polyprotein [Gossypium australe]